MFLKSRSFTFFELIIVILITGIFLALAIPSFTKSYDNYHLNGFAKDLQSFLNYINERAVMENELVLLEVDADRRRYYAKLANETQTRLDFGGGRIPEGLTIKIESDDEQILFYPDGEITDFDINITDKKEKSILLSTKGVFGFVKMYK